MERLFGIVTHLVIFAVFEPIDFCFAVVWIGEDVVVNFFFFIDFKFDFLIFFGGGFAHHFYDDFGCFGDGLPLRHI